MVVKAREWDENQKRVRATCDSARMPLFVGAVTDERHALLAFLEQQREALRAAAYGLTDDDAGRSPASSSLSLGGLIKHVANTERRWVQVTLAGRDLPEIWPVADWAADFRFEPGDSLAALLAGYQAVGAETAATIEALDDMGSPCREPEARTGGLTARWILLHMIEETARHAGQADVIRESLDGRHAGELLRQWEASTRL